MTIPPADPTPVVIGAQPTTALDVNTRIGNCLREFVRAKQTIGQNADWLAGCDLKIAPYFFTAQQETDLKSAVIGLDTSLDAIEMTFVNRLIGLV
jgi:hypothetical protein